MARTNAAMGQATARSGAEAQEAAGNQQTMQTIGSLAAAAAMVMSDERAKKDVRPFDSERVLAELTGVQYRYSDPHHDTGEPEIGVMAQDLERVAPAAVDEGVDGKKRIDYGKMGGFMLAALTDISDRLAAVEGGKTRG